MEDLPLNFQGIVGSFYRASTWISKIATINLVWFFFNIPIIYLLLNALFIHNLQNLVEILILMIIIIPFTFFPATTAMFGVVRIWIIESQDSKTFRLFWKFYKENYIRSMLSGIIIVLFWTIWIFNYFFYSLKDSNIVFFILFLMIGIILIVFTIHFFSMTVHMHLSFFNNLKNVVYLTFGEPFLSILIFVITCVIVYLSVNVLTFLIPFFMGALISYFSFYYFLQTISKFENNDKI